MRDRRKIENISLIILVIIILLIPVYLIKDKVSASRRDKQNNEEETFVGGKTCIQCHAKEFEQWKGSHHDRAMEYANDTTVLGNFNDTVLIAKTGITHKFYKKDHKFFVFTDGEDGEMKEYEIKYTFGFTPLQQYLVEFPGGRLQTLPLVWNSADKNWYHMVDSVYKNEIIDHNNWLHWTNQAQNWNGMCADCHSTNLKKGYDFKTDNYKTTWSEIDVSCEACHGPSSKHLEWANLPEYSRNGFENFGLVVQTSNIDNKQYVNLCARCHTRRASLSDYNLHSKTIYNHMVPQLPVEPHYYIDGQILDEDYVYGSFTQSRMYMNDVKCNDCHEVHSGERLFEGNTLCLQCHVAEKYDTPNHHFHKNKGESGKAVVSVAGVKYEVGSGTECINCHMHAQYYMGVDYRNDHSFRIPRPDLSEIMGSPNACNQCHANKSNQWAQNYILDWYGKSRHFQYGEAFTLARDGKPEALSILRRIYEDELYPEIVRSTAIEYLGQYYQDSSKELLFNAMMNINGLIRHTSVRNLVLDDEKSIQQLLPMLYDETKAIRIECANKFMGIPVDQIPVNYKEALKQATAEYYESLKFNADFPLGKFSLANYYYNNKEYAEAEKFYLAALKQDDQLHAIKVNLAYLYNAMNKPKKAELLFKSYLESNPNDGNVLFSYGLLLSELQRYKESLDYLIRASKVQPDNARIFYNIAMMYDFFEEKMNAEKYLKLAIAKQNNNIGFYSALLNFYLSNNLNAKSKELARDILIRFPDIENRDQLESLLK